MATIRRLGSLTLTLSLVLGAALPVRAADAPGQRAEVPIRDVLLSDGMHRYAIPVQIGGATVQAGLDTGSTGLRVLPGALGDEDAKAGSGASSYSYGSGARLKGVVGQAALTIGGLSGAGSLELIHAVDCVPDMPKCPAVRVALADYGIQGNGLKGEGFKAIIGVNMGTAEVRNPFEAVGAQQWIVELPLPGSNKPGRIIFNPSKEETAGFTMFRVDPAFSRVAGGAHDSIPACLFNAVTKKSFCGPALLDSGDPGITVLNGDGPVWPEGTTAAIAFMQNGKAGPTASFEIGKRQVSSHLTFRSRPPQGVRLHFGAMPYFGYAVLYDPATQSIGLKPRPDSALEIQ